MAIAKSTPGTHESATIHVATIQAGSLPAVDLEKVHDAFRKRLDRSGFNQSMLIGSTEAGWLPKDQVWIVHFHLLAIGVPIDAWAALKEKLADAGRKTPLMVNPLNDPECQISYNHKFVTYYRSFYGDGRSRAFPLPANRLAELAEWRAKYCFEDFQFLYGARRRGGKIVPDKCNE